MIDPSQFKNSADWDRLFLYTLLDAACEMGEQFPVCEYSVDEQGTLRMTWTTRDASVILHVGKLAYIYRQRGEQVECVGVNVENLIKSLGWLSVSKPQGDEDDCGS